MSSTQRHGLRFFTGLLFGATLSTGWGVTGCSGTARPPGVSQETLVATSAILRPAPPPPLSEFCAEIQAQTLDTAETMPQPLDEDTVALAAGAKGCDVQLRYGLITTERSEVTSAGLQAMQRQTSVQLCGERPARRVMEHGGSFTSVYEDRNGQRIGAFRISLTDCFTTVASRR